jgi:hypothetical protein
LQQKEQEKKNKAKWDLLKRKKIKRRYLRRMYERKKGLFSLSFWHIPFYWQKKKNIFFVLAWPRNSFPSFSSVLGFQIWKLLCIVQYKKKLLSIFIVSFFGDGVGHGIKFQNVKVEKNPLAQNNNNKIGQNIKSHEVKYTYSTTHHLRVCYRHLVQWIGCISLLAT